MKNIWSDLAHFKQNMWELAWLYTKIDTGSTEGGNYDCFQIIGNHCIDYDQVAIYEKRH